MPRHPTARRVHRPVEASDAFVARTFELLEWARRHARLLTIAGAIAIVAGGAALYARNYQRALAAKAASQLATVRQTAASGNRALAIRDLEGFLHDYGGTPAGNEARLLLAQLQLQEGKPDQAAAAVRELAEKPTDPLRVAAAFLLAAAHEAAGRTAEAEQVYLRVAERAEFPFQRRDALDAAARLRMERGDARGAAELYDRLLALTEKTAPERAIYEMRRAEALARAEAATGGS